VLHCLQPGVSEPAAAQARPLSNPGSAILTQQIALIHILQLQTAMIEAGLQQADRHRPEDPGGQLAPPPQQLAGMQRQLDVARREVAQLQAVLASPESQCEEACRKLAAERAQAAALRTEERHIANSHMELQEAWKGMVDELKEQLKVMRGHGQGLDVGTETSSMLIIFVLPRLIHLIY
jgi:hypothetical protein